MEPSVLHGLDSAGRSTSVEYFIGLVNIFSIVYIK